jgi:hypothetical protein
VDHHKRNSVFVFSNSQANLTLHINTRNNAGNVNSTSLAMTVLRDSTVTG